MSEKHEIRFIELFAGIGGFRYGLEACNRQQQESSTLSRCGNSFINKSNQSNQSEKWGNYACVWTNELDRYASAIYRYHYRNICKANIRTVAVANIPDHDLIVAGFPCQSFSIAGKRGGFEDTRGTLFFEICRIARAKRTPYLLLENVKGLLSHNSGDTFQTIIRTLDELGYGYQWQVLNSKYFGVPQNRERVFIIANLRGTSRPKIFPIGEVAEYPDRTYQEAQSERERVRDKDNQCASALRIGGSRVQDNLVSATVSSRYYKDDSEILINLTPNNPLSRRVYSPAGISPAISTPSGGHHLPQIAQCLQTDGQLRSGSSWGQDKPQSARNIRRLTPVECERLQGFPDNWTKYGLTKDGKEIKISDTQRYKCCGNAVTTKVIKAIGQRLLEYLSR